MIPIVLLGVFIGLVMGVLGGGGSVLGIPLLRYGFGMTPEMAIGVSLFVVGIGSVIGTGAQMRRGAVSWGIAFTFGGAGAAGAFAGSALARFMPGELQLVLFALLVLGSAIVILRPGKDELTEAAKASQRAAAPSGVVRPPRLEVMVVAGFALGIVTGLLGLGGGFLLVPVFVLVAGLPMHRAVATTMPVVAANSLAGAAGYMTRLDEVPWSFVVSFLVATCLATLVGANISHRVPAKRLRLSYAVLLVALGGLTLVVESIRLWSPA